MTWIMRIVWIVVPRVVNFLLVSVGQRKIVASCWVDENADPTLIHGQITNLGKVPIPLGKTFLRVKGAKGQYSGSMSTPALPSSWAVFFPGMKLPDGIVSEGQPFENSMLNPEQTQQCNYKKEGKQLLVEDGVCRIVFLTKTGKQYKTNWVPFKGSGKP